MIAVDLLEKIEKHTKGVIANQCKKQVLKSGEVAGPSMKWGMRVSVLYHRSFSSLSSHG